MPEFVVIAQHRRIDISDAPTPPPPLPPGWSPDLLRAVERGEITCSRAQRIATARATHRLTTRIEAKLGSGKAPSTPPPADVTFRKVADASPPQLSRLLAPGGALVVLSLLGLFVVSRVSRRTT